MASTPYNVLNGVRAKSLPKKFQKELEKLEYFLTIEKEVARSTAAVYLIGMVVFFENFSEFNKENALRFKTVLKNSSLSVQTINLRIRAVNAYAEMKGKTDWKIRQFKRPKTFHTENVITLEQYQQLSGYLKSEGNMRFYYIVGLLARTGARISEAEQITQDHLAKGYADIYNKGKHRRIYIPKPFAEEYLAWLKQENVSNAFFNIRTRKPLSNRGVASGLKELAIKAGVPVENVYPHSFRHLFAINFLKNNPNLSLLCDLLGHENIKTTAIYLRLSSNEQHEQLNKAVNW